MEERCHSSGPNNFRNSKTSPPSISLLWVRPFSFFLQSFKKFLSRQDQLGFFLFMIERHQHVLHLLRIKESKMNVPPSRFVLDSTFRTEREAGRLGRVTGGRLLYDAKPGESGRQWSGRRTQARTRVRLLLFYIVPHRKVNTPTLTNYFEREVLKIRFCRSWLQGAVAFYNVFPQWTYYKFMKGVTWAYSSR